MIKANIAFGGFYESIHDDNIESAIQMYYSDDNGDLNSFFDIYNTLDFKSIRDNYIKEYASLFQDWINTNYPLSISFCNISLWSPKYYNFETDEILCELQDNDSISLNNYFKDDKEFLEYLKNRTKSYDGFMSFYNFDEALDNKNDILSTYILEFLAKKFNNSDFLQAYDMQSTYDNILH
jgi:hypothetical protein